MFFFLWKEYMWLRFTKLHNRISNYISIVLNDFVQCSIGYSLWEWSLLISVQDLAVLMVYAIMQRFFFKCMHQYDYFMLFNNLWKMTLNDQFTKRICFFIIDNINPFNIKLHAFLYKYIYIYKLFPTIKYIIVVKIDVFLFILSN